MKWNTETEFIKRLVRRGGPAPEDYGALCSWYQRMTEQISVTDDVEAIHPLWAAFGDSLSPETMQGFVVRRPHGYHGDFEIIDRIYTERVTKVENLRNWDIWFHQLAAPQAVRNRKAYFHAMLGKLEGRGYLSPPEPIRVLDVGSGPARDVLEYLEGRSSNGVYFTCLDQDRKAIDYAHNLCGGYLDKIELVQSPILRYSSTRKFDLVWCAGVFDYLDDRMFKIVLKKLLRLVAHKGELVLGNFSPLNPTRVIMEFGGWKLFHRSESQLRDLALNCGIEPDQIAVGKEPEGVNLFLHISSVCEPGHSNGVHQAKLWRPLLH